jgi:ribosomal protein S18 acetylase RimI-like enzyme
MHMETSFAATPANGSVIQPAGWRDLNSVRQLESICFPMDAWPLWDVIGVLTLPNVVRLKAMLGGQMVGFIAGDIRRSENVAWIATIGVLPEYRRMGIGSGLLQACEARLDTPTVRLCVRRTNRAAIGLYESLGYYHLNTWPGYYQDREDALVLEKKLQPPEAKPRLYLRRLWDGHLDQL